MKPKRQRLAVLFGLQRLLLHDLPRAICEPRHHRLASKSRRSHLCLNRHRRILKRGLAHVDLLHRQIARRFTPPDHDGIDRRHAREIRQAPPAQVRRIPIRQQQNSRERAALESLFQSLQRRRQSRRPPVKS